MSSDPQHEAAITAVMQMLASGATVNKTTIRTVVGAANNDVLGAIIKEAKSRRKGGVDVPAVSTASPSDDDRKCAALGAQMGRLLSEARADERARAERQIAFERGRVTDAEKVNEDQRGTIKLLLKQVSQLKKEARDAKTRLRHAQAQKKAANVMTEATTCLRQAMAAAASTLTGS